MCTGTDSDALNCGSCGHVCKIAEHALNSQNPFACPPPGPGSECCSDGVCTPFWGGCVTARSGFANCAAYCESIGETCADNGCLENQATWIGFMDSVDCSLYSYSSEGAGACDEAFDWSDTRIAQVRCCCTDT
jgi:hypothetical protein